MAAASVFTARPCLAEEEAFDPDLLTPKERARIEDERRRRKPAVLSCSPSSIWLRVRKGETASARLTVRNAGGQTLSWSVRSAPKWVTIDVRAGDLGYAGRRTFAVVVDPSALAEGIAKGEIVVEAEDALRSPVRIPVQVEVQPERPPEKPPPVTERPRRKTPETPREPDRPKDPALALGAGVRAGYFGIGSADRGGDGAAVLVGVYVGRPKSTKVSWEVGLDLVQSEASDGSYASTMVGGRLDVLFPVHIGGGRSYGRGRRRSMQSKVYLVSGVEGIYETAEEAGGRYANLVSALNLGAGVGLDAGRFDVRLTYSVLLGSENSAGLVLVSAGMTF